MNKEEKKLIGEDIKTCELGWPIGMPVSRNMGDKKSRMILLHGFIKKTPKTPENDLKLARQRKAKHEELK